MRDMRTLPIVGGGLAAAAAAVAVVLTGAKADPLPLAPTDTPIKHVVVIFDENESFDHYFGTYPNATNPPGEPKFTAKDDTPAVNGLNETLLNNNPNSSPPVRLDRSEAVTCSQNHAYSAEQMAYDGGLVDKFPEFTAGGSCATTNPTRGKSIVMDYYDGNTVTALWNLAQNFSLNDNSFSTQFGPSTVGALNLVSGQTHGANVANISGSVENNTVIGDPEPSTTLDDCSSSGGITMSGKNIGDLLNAHNVSWGWFQGGFTPTSVAADGTATCGSAHHNLANANVRDYVEHHEPFEYYASTANKHHLPPTSTAMIGSTDQANHQYDLTAFDRALAAGNLPSVSFLKPAAFENGHPSNSDPIDEQHFIARTLNALESSPAWSSTAVIIAYDDSDGWYDHVMPPIVSPSAATSDALNGAGKCGNVPANSTAYPDRCGYGPRQPLLVISPYAKVDFVDNTLTDQTSVLRFIEDNWGLGRIGDQSYDARAGSLGNMFDFNPNDKRAAKVFLDPETGLVTKTDPGAGPVSGQPTPTPTPAGNSVSQDTTVSGTVDGGTLPTVNAVKVAGTTLSGKPAKLKLTCKATGKGKKVTVSCSATGSDAKAKGIAVRFRIVKGKSVLSTSRTTLKNGRAKATLKFRRSLRKGKYTLRIAVTNRGGVMGLTQSVKLG
jgi:phospholipase C